MAESFDRAVPLEAFKSPLRNIRARLDGTNLTLDLIPSLVLDQPVSSSFTSDFPEVDDVLNEIIGKGRPIVEGARFLRAKFEGVGAVAIQEEFIELFEIFECDADAVPPIEGGKGWFPFVRVMNSKWRATLPDYQGGDSVDIQHYRLVSMETHIDLLGILVGTEWLKNCEHHSSNSMSQ